MKVTLAVQQNMQHAPKLMLARDSTNEKLSLARVSFFTFFGFFNNHFGSLSYENLIMDLNLGGS